MRAEHSREKCQLQRFSDVICRVEVPEIKERLKDIDKLVEFDEKLKDHSRDYSARGHNQRSVDYINFFELQWLLFYDPGDCATTMGMKGHDIAAANFERSPWTALYEYSAVQRLLMHIIRPRGEHEAMSAALELCDHAVSMGKHKQADVYWRVALLLESRLEKDTYNVTRLFQVGKAKTPEAPHLAILSLFRGFAVDSVEFVAEGKEELVPGCTQIVEGINEIPFAKCGKVPDSD